MKFKYTLTMNWENAFRGLRHPLESYSRSDSEFGIAENDEWLKEVANEVIYSYNENPEDIFEARDELYDKGILQWGKYIAEYAFIGKNDLDLAQRMIKAGTPNDKFLRQIFVSVDITAPLYWWKEMDTYKIGTTANSTSTMHKLATTPITFDCFETDDMDKDIARDFPYHILCYCEELRLKYLETKDIKYWKELIRWLPESWLQTRTWTANYSILRNIYHWRKNHKLIEWASFCNWISQLPYANELILFEN